MSNNLEPISAEVMRQDRWKTIVTTLAATRPNPHAYLDTFAILGDLEGQLDTKPKRWFALDTANAPFLQFSGLALLAA